jgi:hypothetical protein
LNMRKLLTQDNSLELHHAGHTCRRSCVFYGLDWMRSSCAAELDIDSEEQFH